MYKIYSHVSGYRQQKSVKSNKDYSLLSTTHAANWVIVYLNSMLCG